MNLIQEICAHQCFTAYTLEPSPRLVSFVFVSLLNLEIGPIRLH